MSQKSNKIIIELYGLPGVGKSTLARTLALEHGFFLVPSSSVSRFDYIALSMRYPLMVGYWLLLIFKNYQVTKSIKHLRYNISLLFMSLKKILTAYRSKQLRVVVDEGLLQRLLSCSDILLSKKDIARLVACSPHGNLLVLVNDREVLHDRFTSSAHARASEGETLLKQWRQNLKANLETLTPVIQCLSLTHFETKKSSVDAILAQISSKNNTKF